MENLGRIRLVGDDTIGRRGLEEIWGALRFGIKKGERNRWN